MSKEENKSKVRPEQLPQAVIEQLQAKQKKLQVPYEELEKMYIDSINDDFIRKDPSFKTEAECKEYVLALIEAKIYHRKTEIMRSKLRHPYVPTGGEVVRILMGE